MRDPISTGVDEVGPSRETGSGSNHERGASGLRTLWREASSLRTLWLETGGPAWVLSPRRLWLTSIALHRHGHVRLATVFKWLNGFLFQNSLPPEATVSPDIQLKHHALGVVLSRKVVIGRGVMIHQNVTMTVRPSGSPHNIVIEDNVTIGANAVLVTPKHRGIRIGKGARVGAGAIVTHDVPPYMVAVCAPAEVRPRRRGTGDGRADAEIARSPG